MELETGGEAYPGAMPLLWTPGLHLHFPGELPAGIQTQIQSLYLFFKFSGHMDNDNVGEPDCWPLITLLALNLNLTL